MNSTVIHNDFTAPNATNQIEKNMKELGKEYMRNDHLGYITHTCVDLKKGRCTEMQR